MITIFFGAPGVGKGTQAALLSERHALPHLSTGEALRNAINQGTDVGKLAAQYMNAGSLVPDDVVTRIVDDTLASPAYASGAILDGFPRTLSQAEALDALLSAQGKSVSSVINIVVEREEIVQRMLNRKRKDDTPDVIAHRMDVYEKETAPLLDYYGRKNGLIRTIDGNADVETVYNRINEVFS